MNEKQISAKSIILPPHLPQNEAELEITIALLGNRKQCELGAQARLKLEKLIGIYPTAKEAAIWKRTLRRVYQESIQTGSAAEV